MIKVPTVLILGAGASIPFGFPSGLQLKAEICKAIKKQHGEVFEDLKLSAGNENRVQDFYDNLLLSSEMSIDAFLEHNPDYSQIGRRAIANVLLRKEKHIELYENWIDKWLDPTNKDKHWYQLFFSKLNAPFEDFEKNDLKIITFNYDRSLEYFLWKSMKAKYSKQDEKAILEKLHKIPILHIYGKLGSLPEYDSKGPYVPYDLFGSDRGKEEHWWRGYIYEASCKIITIHDQAEELKDVIEEAQKFLMSAQRIYFLGFGYDKINMERLFILNNGVNLLKEGGLGGKCYGTALDLSPHHKVFLNGFGLERMGQDLVQESRGDISKPFKFPNSTIYDFLYYNRFSVLD
jgi:hypothetical protein